MNLSKNAVITITILAMLTIAAQSATLYIVLNKPAAKCNSSSKRAGSKVYATN